jgi:hypothetical membrane protein
MQRSISALAWLAATLWAGGAIGFGIALDGYSHALHPLGLLGASGVPHARTFNVVAFVVPGLFLAGAGLGLRSRLDAAGWPARIGATLVVLSALAFAAQGVFPLDPEHLDSGDSRYHAAAWTLWWVSFAPGAALLASGARPRLLHVAAAVGVPVLALVASGLVGGALAQRLAFAAWFGWWLLALRWPR